MKKYTREHEWIEPSGDAWRVGITNYAQEQLGDVVAVDLPPAGATVAAGEECGAIESVKAASDVYAPAGGTITAVNKTLEDDPAQVNESAEDKGWLWEMSINDESELEAMMSGEEYQRFLEHGE